MPRMWGLALAGLMAGACGHATPTGSAQNGWVTPTGNATATNPRYVNPLAAAHPARDRSLFAERQAPSLQPAAADEALPLSNESAPIVAEPPSGPVPPPAEVLPPPETVPDDESIRGNPRMGEPPYLRPPMEP